ncbi:MAG: lysylphosphatidylglycerol synthetase-like protein (DUF2156 family) [Kiritimatiellia bacterium]|jgi:lysylphosphatidylglycerol synthetase-like protein (DUF2156 family)
MRSVWLDALLRHVLAIPGVVVDLLDGRPSPPEFQDPDRVYGLVRAAARHPQAHLALEEGLHYHVDDEAIIAYQVRRATAFAVGGLNVEPLRRAQTLRRFRDSLSQQGLRRHMLFPLRRDELRSAFDAGFDALQVGVEAWIDLQDFGLHGKAMAHLRQMRNRARRRGVQVGEVAVDDHKDSMALAYERWLEAKRPSWRMKLLVGSPGLDRPFDRRFFVATDDSGLQAFCTVVPGAPGEWGVDVMCRQPDAVPGSMERLLLCVIETLKEEGATALSLGPCPMAGVPLRGKGLPLRYVFHLLYSSWLGNQVFGFRSLYRFKGKFRPRWEPVYFAASPRLGPVELYQGCRMWGLY